MLEVLLILALLGALAAIGAASMLPATWLFGGGAVLIGIGLLVGVPTAIVYHVLLRRGLIRVDALDPKWIWDPIGRHELLLREDRRAMLPWFYVAGGAFGVNCIGLAGWVIGTFVLFSRGV